MSYDFEIDVPESTVYPQTIDIPFSLLNSPIRSFGQNVQILCFVDPSGFNLKIADFLYKETRDPVTFIRSGRLTGTIAGDIDPRSSSVTGGIESPWRFGLVSPGKDFFDTAAPDRILEPIPYSIEAEYQATLQGFVENPFGPRPTIGKILFKFPPYWRFVGDGEEPEVGTPPTTGVSTDNPYGPVTPSIPLVGVPDAADPPCLTPSFVQPAPPISTPCASVSNGSTTQGTFTKLS